VIARLFLFRNFAVADPATRLWKVRQAKCIAEGFAEKQRWLITPKRDTCDFLLDALAHALVAVLSGSWDELARKDAVDESAGQDGAMQSVVSRGQLVLRILAAGLRTVAVAALPAAALWMARSHDLLSKADPRTLDYIEIGVFVWAVLILAFLLDPRLQEKIAGVKDVVSLVNPLSGKKRGD